MPVFDEANALWLKRMTEDYKGEISIRSKEGKGTTLMIILPTNM